MRQVTAKGLSGVQVVLGEDVSSSGSSAVRVHPRELDDVKAPIRRLKKMPTLALDKVQPRVLYPLSKVVSVSTGKYFHGSAVDFYRSDICGVERKSGKDIETAADAYNQDLRQRYRSRMVCSRVNGLLDSPQGLPRPVVVNGIGEGIVVLGEHALEPCEKYSAFAKKRGKGACVRVERRRDTGDLDACHGVPRHMLDRHVLLSVCQDRSF